MGCVPHVRAIGAPSACVCMGLRAHSVRAGVEFRSAQNPQWNPVGLMHLPCERAPAILLLRRFLLIASQLLPICNLLGLGELCIDPEVDGKHRRCNEEVIDRIVVELLWVRAIEAVHAHVLAAGRYDHENDIARHPQDVAGEYEAQPGNAETTAEYDKARDAANQDAPVHGDGAAFINAVAQAKEHLENGHHDSERFHQLDPPGSKLTIGQ
mmetsp:Transcript_11173/g.27991  ORF Transcript_11173/g.27991 Transcript_11173/m.27991 type:complete len:211 (-) Transcript_11173:453-1085(-)